MACDFLKHVMAIRECPSCSVICLSISSTSFIVSLFIQARWHFLWMKMEWDPSSSWGDDDNIKKHCYMHISGVWIICFPLVSCSWHCCHLSAHSFYWITNCMRKPYHGSQTIGGTEMWFLRDLPCRGQIKKDCHPAKRYHWETLAIVAEK